LLNLVAVRTGTWIFILPLLLFWSRTGEAIFNNCLHFVWIQKKVSCLFVCRRPILLLLWAIHHFCESFGNCFTGTTSQQGCQTQYTKTGENIPNDPKITKYP
jgi:hypothetical protein